MHVEGEDNPLSNPIFMGLQKLKSADSDAPVLVEKKTLK